MLEILPLCRKEKYFTSCILPQLLCGDLMQRLNNFLFFLNVDNEFIHNNYSINNLSFYTEYSLKESADWPELANHLSKETPDLVILIRSKDTTSYLLIVIEAKMYSRVSAKKFREQLDLQKPIIRIIKDKIGIKEKDIIHIGLLKDIPHNLSVQKNERIISWAEIIKIYKSIKENYFYKTLEFAILDPKIARPLKRGVHSTTKRYKNYFDISNFHDIKILCEKKGEQIMVGFSGGKKALINTDTNSLATRKFKWDFVKSSLGKKQKTNWISGDIFLELVRNK